MVCYCGGVVAPGAPSAPIVDVVVAVEEEEAQVLLQLLSVEHTHTDNGICWDCVTFFLAQQQIGM